MPKINITCPSCKKQYMVEVEDGQTYNDMDCPNCGGKIPVCSSKQPAVKRSAPRPPWAASCLCFCSVLSFIASWITAINNEIQIAAFLSGSGIILILFAIYKKIPYK